MTRHDLTVLERIYRRCRGTRHPDGCWTWQGAMRGFYGVVRVKVHGRESTRNVHRVVYAEVTGDVPEGISVLHTCHNKLCCNPRHLTLKVQPLDLGVSEAVSLDVGMFHDDGKR